MKALLGMTEGQVSDWLKDRGVPGYRCGQILEWVYRHRVAGFGQMKTVPGWLRDELRETFFLYQGEVVQVQQSGDEAWKSLIRWVDGASCEVVLICADPKEGKGRRTVCVSCQSGCPVGCVFCASGQGGLDRNLHAWEMVEQVMVCAKQLEPTERVSHVVVMGMGEPFANYEQVMRAVTIMNAPWGLGIGARHITISTIGVPEGIRRLSREAIQVTLAVSLHAGNDGLRSQLIPWAGQISLKQLFKAIDDYYEKTHREVTLEYVLLDGVNCGERDAKDLAGLAMGSRCNVNLIAYNPVKGSAFRRPSREVVDAFVGSLEGRGVNVHLRRSLGGEIDAACGQLRARREENE